GARLRRRARARAASVAWPLGYAEDLMAACRATRWVMVGGLVVTSACSAGADPPTDTTTATGAGGAATTTAAVTIGVGSGPGQGGGGEDGCSSLTQDGERKPLHLYVLLDKSSSMVGDKWDNATSGIGQFATDEASA